MLSESKARDPFDAHQPPEAACQASPALEGNAPREAAAALNA